MGFALKLAKIRRGRLAKIGKGSQKDGYYVRKVTGTSRGRAKVPNRTVGVCGLH